MNFYPSTWNPVTSSPEYVPSHIVVHFFQPISPRTASATRRNRLVGQNAKRRQLAGNQGERRGERFRERQNGASRNGSSGQSTTAHAVGGNRTCGSPGRCRAGIAVRSLCGGSGRRIGRRDRRGPEL